MLAEVRYVTHTLRMYVLKVLYGKGATKSIFE